MTTPILFSTESYRYLLNEIVQLSGYELGELNTTIFPDTEVYHRFLTDVSKRDVILIGGTQDDHNTMELYDLAQGIAHQGANSLSIIIPYFGYSTMERAVLTGEIVKAKNRALIFSSIPSCAEANNVYLMDLHSEGIPYYFDRDIRCNHIYCKQVIISAAQEINHPDFVLGATDAGRAKWVESLAREMKVRSAFIYKQRTGGSSTHITAVNADVKDKVVFIYDDMIRTGGSLMQAAQAYVDAGATSIYALATHGLFTQDALLKIEQQSIIKEVIICNTHPAVYQQKSKLLKIKSVAGIIFDTLK